MKPPVLPPMTKTSSLENLWNWIGRAVLQYSYAQTDPHDCRSFLKKIRSKSRVQKSPGALGKESPVGPEQLRSLVEGQLSMSVY